MVSIDPAGAAFTGQGFTGEGDQAVHGGVPVHQALPRHGVTGDGAGASVSLVHAMVQTLQIRSATGVLGVSACGQDEEQEDSK